MKKTLLWIILCAVLLTTVACFAGCSNTSEDILEFEFSYDGRYYYVAGPKDSSQKGRNDIKKIVIPDTYDGLPVTRISAEAFRYCNNLESITIPIGITSIGREAFQGCQSLKSITIPYGVSYIGMLAFYGCTALESVTIPNSVTQIESSVFDYCPRLKIITYTGTKAEWEKIEKWDHEFTNYMINCSDGTIG